MALCEKMALCMNFERRTGVRASFPSLLSVIGLALAAQALSGCVATGIGLGAGAVVAFQEERGIGGAVDDTAIRLAITDLWLREDHTLLGDLGLMIYDGRVLVTGNVDDEATMDRAISLAWQPRGVGEIINEVRIASPRGLATVATDQVTTKKLQAQMLVDREIRTINYHRRTYDGTVYILGIAQDRTELDRVLALAHNISGVRNVVGHIDLVGNPTRAARAGSTVDGGRFPSDADLDPQFNPNRPNPIRMTPITPVTPQGRVSVSTLQPLAGDGASDPRRTSALSDNGDPIPLTRAPYIGDTGPTRSIEAAALGAETNPRDAEISLKINELWYEEDPNMYRRLGLLVQDERVVITGVVTDEEMRGAPYRLAWQVPGVREVYNETRVGDAPLRSEIARDRLIESEMIVALQANRSVETKNYAISAEHGHLYILGTATSPGELDTVESIASSLDGVEGVISHLILEETTKAR